MTELEPSSGGRRWWAIVAGVVAAALLLVGGFWLATGGDDDSDAGTTGLTSTDGGGATVDDGDETTTDGGSTATETDEGDETTATSGPERIEFEGEGNDRTETFEVQEGWRIEWESFGDRFAMTISGDQNLGTVVNVDEPTSGLTTPPSPGRYRIEVEAEGRWTIAIDPGG